MTGLVLLNTALPYRFVWDREGRKGQACRILVRGKLNSILVEFPDGFRMVTSFNAIRRNSTAKEKKQ